MYSIAIDGPAGAGKSTIAKGVASQLEFIYVDTGALYRSIALYFIQNKVDVTESIQVKQACNELQITIGHNNGEQQVILNGENVNEYLRAEEVGNMASSVAALPEVRARLLELQRDIASNNSVVMDGRDIGTCILPNANLKIYLTASSKVRAMRRHKELVLQGKDCDMEAIEADIIERDKRDMSREISPLVQAEDAILLDSSNLSIDEVIQAIIIEYNKIV